MASTCREIMSMKVNSIDILPPAQRRLTIEGTCADECSTSLPEQHRWNRSQPAAFMAGMRVTSGTWFVSNALQMIDRLRRQEAPNHG